MNQSRPSPAWPDFCLALGIVALGIFFAAGTFELDVNPSYAKVSPKFFPLVVAVALVFSGAWLAWLAWNGDRAEPASEEDADPNAPINWWAFAWISVGFATTFFLLQPLGFVPCAWFLFFCATKAFASQQTARDLVAGLVLALVAYLVFTRGLGLDLPAGILKGVL